MNLFIKTNIKSSVCREIIDRQDYDLDEYGGQVIQSCLYELIDENKYSRPNISYLKNKIESVFSFLDSYCSSQIGVHGKKQFIESEKFWPIEILYMYIGQIIDYVYYLGLGNDTLIKIKNTRNKFIIHDIDGTRYVKSYSSTINNKDIYFEYGLQVFIPGQEQFIIYISPLKDLYIVLCELFKILDS